MQEVTKKRAILQARRKWAKEWKCKAVCMIKFKITSSGKKTRNIANSKEVSFERMHAVRKSSKQWEKTSNFACSKEVS